MFLAFVIIAIFAGGMLTAAANDALTMTIPNWVSVMVLASFFVIMPFVWQGWADFGLHLAVGTGVFVLGFILFALGLLGGGDAKLMAATSFWWLPADLVLYVFYTTLAGGALALLIFLGRVIVPDVLLVSTPRLHHLVKEQTHMPYGLALAFGALATLPQSAIFLAAIG